MNAEDRARLDEIVNGRRERPSPRASSADVAFLLRILEDESRRADEAERTVEAMRGWIEQEGLEEFVREELEKPREGS